MLAQKKEKTPFETVVMTNGQLPNFIPFHQKKKKKKQEPILCSRKQPSHL
jgi:hypothetical protein